MIRECQGTKKGWGQKLWIKIEKGLKKGVIREGEGIKELGIVIREWYGTKRGGGQKLRIKIGQKRGEVVSDDVFQKKLMCY